MLFVLKLKCVAQLQTMGAMKQLGVTTHTVTQPRYLAISKVHYQISTLVREKNN